MKLAQVTKDALSLLAKGDEQSRVALTKIMQAADQNGCWLDEYAMADIGQVSTLKGMAAVCLSWEINEFDGDRDDSCDGVRDLCIEFLAKNHPHGAYNDSEAEANGYAPLNVSEIHSMLTEVY